MKKIYTLIAAALLATGAAAQNPTAYFMEGSTFRSQFNPAFAPLRGYVNIPAIGGVNINVGGNIAVDNILFSRDGKLVTLLTAPCRPPTHSRASSRTTCWAWTSA